MTSSKQRFKTSLITFLLSAVFLATLLAGSGLGENLRFVFLADCRGKDPSSLINTKALQEINTRILALTPRPAFVLFGGDLALTGLNADGSNNFQAFKQAMKPVTDAGIKLYVALGNHELYKMGVMNQFFREGQEQYRQAFADLPGNGPPGYEKLVYSFESPGGDAFFAVLDPYYMPPGITQKPFLGHNPGLFDARQLQWLRDQLAGTRATHKFLCSHVPIHQVNEDKPDSSYFDLWSILDKARFDLYLCGHVHLYSRRAIDRTVDPRWQNSVVQLLCGTAGAPSVAPDSVIRNLPNWHINVGSYYYSVVDISGPRVTVDSYGGKDGKYTVIDDFTVTSGRAARRPAQPAECQVPMSR